MSRSGQSNAVTAAAAAGDDAAGGRRGNDDDDDDEDNDSKKTNVLAATEIFGGLLVTRDARGKLSVIMVHDQDPPSDQYKTARQPHGRGKSDGGASSTMTTSHSTLTLPRILESPLGPAKSLSILIRKTHGSFAHEEWQQDQSFMHCGVSNSRGIVFHFDEEGKHEDITWRECVSIPLLSHGTFSSSSSPFSTPPSSSQLDSELQRYHSSFVGDKDSSCFTYLCDLLNSLDYHPTRMGGRNDEEGDQSSSSSVLLTLPALEQGLLLYPVSWAIYNYLPIWKKLNAHQEVEDEEIRQAIAIYERSLIHTL